MFLMKQDLFMRTEYSSYNKVKSFLVKKYLYVMVYGL